MTAEHVAIIMDGNGRWAKKRLLPRSAGHRAGFRRMLSLCEHAFERGVRCLTLYALSEENLSRPKEEVEALFSLFREFFPTPAPKLKEHGIKLRVIGGLALLPEDIRAMIPPSEELTAGGTRGTLYLALAYSGRGEIVSAANRAVKEGKEVTRETFSSFLSVPPVDLLIRTGGELRLSDFLLYESAYAELYFTKKFFPDFTNGDFDKALKEFSLRDRRFGRI